MIQYAGGGLHYICEAINPWLDRPLAERGPAPLDIGAAPTCGLLLDRQAAIDVGLFDERYFIGKEDGDFTHRICLAGYRILELPEALVLHRSRPRGTWLFYYQIRNRWHFMLKNYQWRTLMLDSARAWPSTNRCSSSCFTSRVTASSTGSRSPGCWACCRACRATAR